MRVCVCVEVFPSMCSSTYLAKVHSLWNASPAQHFPLKKSDRKRKIPFHFGIANDTKEKNIWVRHTRQPYLYFLSPERKRKKQVKETKQPIETLGVGCPMQVIRHTQPDYVIARLSHIFCLSIKRQNKKKTKAPPIQINLLPKTPRIKHVTKRLSCSIRIQPYARAHKENIPFLHLSSSSSKTKQKKVNEFIHLPGRRK